MTMILTNPRFPEKYAIVLKPSHVRRCNVGTHHFTNPANANTIISYCRLVNVL